MMVINFTSQSQPSSSMGRDEIVPLGGSFLYRSKCLLAPVKKSVRTNARSPSGYSPVTHCIVPSSVR